MSFIMHICRLVYVWEAYAVHNLVESVYKGRINRIRIPVLNKTHGGFTSVEFVKGDRNLTVTCLNKWFTKSWDMNSTQRCICNKFQSLFIFLSLKHIGFYLIGNCSVLCLCTSEKHGSPNGKAKVTMVYNIVKSLVDIPLHPHLNASPRYKLRYIIPHTNINCYQKWFFVNGVALWNKLAGSVNELEWVCV